jgi:hypothetical protein
MNSYINKDLSLFDIFKNFSRQGTLLDRQEAIMQESLSYNEAETVLKMIPKSQFNSNTMYDRIRPLA